MDNDMEEELRTHIQHRADDLERSGLNRPEAERRARIEFGGHGRFKEECHEALGGNFFETLINDARFSVRVLRKSPGFTIVAVLTLALAIGANAVVFGILNGLILRPLNVPHSENLLATEYGDGSGWQSYPNYLDLRRRNRSFDALAAFNFAFVGLDTGDNPSTAAGYATTGNYFDVLNIQPYLGRVFHASDEHGPNSAPYIVLTCGYWHSHFQDDRGVVGRTVRLNKHPFTILGVTPPSFEGTMMFISPDFFMPLVNLEQTGQPDPFVRANDRGVFEVLGHLKPGVTQAQALADVNSVAKYLEKTYPKDFRYKSSTLSRPGLSGFDRGVRAFMAGLMLLAGLILLAACANLGNLFAARAADRSREVALRLALGSSRSRILRGLFTEAGLISLAGAATGLLGALWILDWISTWKPFRGAPVHIPVNPDARVYVIALALALVSAFLFGIVPVRQVLRIDPYQVVKSGLTGKPGRRITLRDLLLCAQIAICAVLVTSSLVAFRGLLRSLHGNFGFEPRNTMLAGTNLAMAGYAIDKVPGMQKRMIEAIKTIPGVERAALVDDYPPLVYTAGSRVSVFKEEETDLRPGNAVANPYRYAVSPEYFLAAQTTLLAGRDLSWHDDSSAPLVALVNREFAGKLFGAVNKAVGQLLQDARRKTCPGGWSCRRRKISGAHRGSRTSGICFIPAIAHECVLSRRPLLARSATACRGHAE